jgi:YD repeat-containing protein
LKKYTLQYNYIITFALVFLVCSLKIFSQSSSDITLKNEEKELIKKSSIKSKAIWEYRYAGGNEEVLSDSGYKSYYFTYDDFGRITGYTKYHIFTDLTIREIYAYGKTDNIKRTVRYNSNGDMIETIDYKYNSSGKLKKEIHTAYLNRILPGVYFTIHAYVDENELFARLQDDLAIEPKLESYTITVNISDEEELNQYIVIGDESDPTSPRFSWSQLSVSSQRDILSYKGPNRKEHEYINKNIELVTYKYDKKGNLTGRSVYNTANDLIEKESYNYDDSNNRINFYKYNEDGKISSMEKYSYDSKGRLTEASGLDPDGKISGKLTYKYNESDNIDEKIWYDSQGEIKGRFKYIYNSENKLAEETKFTGENEKDSSLKYKYDAQGNILEIIKYNTDNKKEKLIKYLYDFY